ncbi:tryptophan 2,3-dioxygenase [Jatrophihabitans sp.]|uniref:tryptophan 2,3-dioxygenase n=1 Tax=Jatrophihabitans sp. TaxID=1932789 RepID=UPI002CEED8C0|nr:tryptophan 2,3-dioxygenase family protein [Jatrophihabitans sp.]
MTNDASAVADPEGARPPGASPDGIEAGIRLDFREEMSYGDYLHLGELLGAQHPLSRPVAHDELLFIIQHQTSELWLKLLLHELLGAREGLRTDDIGLALKRLARVKGILHTLTDQWTILATLTPSEYLSFRDSLASSSGFQSFQYRAVEFILGNKNARMLQMFSRDAAAHALLTDLLNSPTLYDEFLGYLSRHGYPLPASVTGRDVTEAHTFTPELVDIFKVIYDAPAENWDLYEGCEALVDLEDAFQFWRFRHLKTVERMIGGKTGTGGSSGATFLRKALDRTFFPELYSVRTALD